MATNPEATEDRNQPIYRRAIQAVQNTVSSRTWKNKVFLAVAAALGCLAPLPFGPVVVLLLVLVAAEGR